MKPIRPIYELSLKEQEELLQPIIEKVQHDNLAAGSFNVYRDSNFISKDIFVREYSDRKVLVRVSMETGHTEIIMPLAK